MKQTHLEVAVAAVAAVAAQPGWLRLAAVLSPASAVAAAVAAAAVAAAAVAVAAAAVVATAVHVGRRGEVPARCSRTRTRPTSLT